MGTETRSQRAVDLVKSGTHSKAEAARAVGLDRRSVGIACALRGIPRGLTERGVAVLRVRPADRQRRIAASAIPPGKDYRSAVGNPEPDIVFAMYESGYGSFSDIANRFGVSRNVIAGMIYRQRLTKKNGGSNGKVD